jgi:hypothetical protein
MLAPRPGLEPGTCGLTVCRTVTLDHVLSLNSAPQLSQIRWPQAQYWRGVRQNCGAIFIIRHGLLPVASEKRGQLKHAGRAGSDHGPDSCFGDNAEANSNPLTNVTIFDPILQLKPPRNQRLKVSN